MYVRARERHTETVIPLSPVKPFHVKPHTGNGPAATPHAKATESVEERNTEAEKKQKETDILSISGV